MGWSLGTVPPTLAAPAPVGSSSSSSPDVATAITIARPPVTAAGQVMIASLVVQNAGESFAAPQGWSRVTDHSIPATLRLAVYVKVAGPSEPADYTWTVPIPRRLSGGVTTYAGVDPTHPIDAHAAWTQPAAGVAVPAPPLATSVPDALLVRLSAMSADGTGPVIAAVVALRPAGTPSPPPDPVLVGAGDIASCRSPGDEATAALIDQIPGTVFTAGDNAYINGTAQEFANCYEPTWGRFKDRTRPAPGNHEYQSDRKAAGYYGYFGAAAGDPTKGYYDYRLGAWHVIVLNSNCVPAGGCQAGSPQEQWLRAVLAASDAVCTVAINHHPRFSSAVNHGSDVGLQPFWQALYDHGADLVISGHDHVYERFAPLRPDGLADPLFGVRQIVAGTGGRSYRQFGPPVAGSEVRIASTFGVLKLTLHADSYDWEFIPEAGKTRTDQGTGACHGAPPSYPPTTVTPPPSTTLPTS